MLPKYLPISMIIFCFYFQAKVELHAEGLEVWPGYITSMRQHEESTLLCCELKSKILRIDSVLDIVSIYSGGSNSEH